MKHIAIILAGGTGSRVGGQTPKQFLPMDDGRSVLEHAVDAFETAPCIDETAVVMHPDFMEEARQLCERNAWTKLHKIIPGGSERWESSWHAILAYMDEETDAALWFHDAARPFVSQRIISGVAEALETHEAVTVAVPVTDTIYKVQSGAKWAVQSTKETVESVPPRSSFMRAQTPQAFRIGLVASAYMKAIGADYSMATDDAGIVRKFEPAHPVFIVPGEEENRKITYKEDL